MYQISSKLEKPMAKKLVHVAMGVVLLVACAKLYIPLNPVPISMHTVAIMLIAMLYSRRDGMQMLGAYLSLGAAGMPVFAGHNAGLQVLFGPTGGYLMGFAAAIYVMNIIKTKISMDSFVNIFVNCLAGTVAIFSCGIAWLSLTIGFKEALIIGLLPFIIPGAIKAVILSGFIKSVRVVCKD